MSVHQVLYDIHPSLAWPGFTSVIFIAVSGGVIAIVIGMRGERDGQARSSESFDAFIALTAATLVGLALIQFSLAAWYLKFPSYLDWAEARSAAISWLTWQGRPGYPPIGAGDLYIQ